MTGRRIIAVGLLAGTFLSTAVQAQDAVVMRRPLPTLTTRSDPSQGTTPTPTPGGTPAPGTTPTPTPGGTPAPTPGTTPTPTPTPGSTPTPTPAPGSDPSVPDPGETGPRPDPKDAICDVESREGAAISDVAWVASTALSPDSCTRTTYSCQATYTCSVNGHTTSFTASAPDSTCENSETPVAYPAGTSKSADTATADALVLRRFGVDVRNFAAKTIVRAVNYTSDMGMPRYDWSAMSDGNGYESVQTYANSTYAYAYVYGRDPTATCRRINEMVGVTSLQDVDRMVSRLEPEFCADGRYYRRIDDAQTPYQIVYVRSLGQAARAQVAPGFVPVYQGGYGIPVMEEAQKPYRLITAMSGDYTGYDTEDDKRIYGADRKPAKFFLYATVETQNLCRAIDNAVNGGRSANGLARLDTIHLDEGCGMGPNYPTYWRRLDDSFGPAAAKNILAFADQATAKASALAQPVDTMAKMGMPNEVPNPVRQDNTFGAGRAEITDTGYRRIMTILVHSAECDYINRAVGYTADAQDPALYYVNRDKVSQGCSKTYSGSERVYWRQMDVMFARAVTTLQAFGSAVAAASDGKRPTSLAEIGFAQPAYLVNVDFANRTEGYFFRGMVDRGVCRQINQKLRGTSDIPDGYNPYVGTEGCGNRSGDMVYWRKVG